MKKLTIYVMLILSMAFSFSVYSQSTSVPSPSASQMTRYSGVSLNESSGRVTASIPIYNYQAGSIGVPIGLSYVGNGVKVDQHSNWVGTNWNLSAGGVVTRVVNHIADETATNRLFAEDNSMLSDITNHGQYIIDLIEGENLNDDLRPDLFSFSFPGYSGTFYLDKNDQPRLMNASSELLIELANSPTDVTLMNTIIITTPNGLKYYFGGDDASESSSTLIDVHLIERGPPGSSNNTPVDLDVFPKAITAFYLYKIEHPFGSSVFFDYHDDGDKEYLMFRGEQLRSIEDGDSLDEDDICYTVLGMDGMNTIEMSVYKGKVYDRKKISRIYSPNSNKEILFNSEQLVLDITSNMDDEYYDPEYDDRVLNSISIYDTSLDQNIKHVKLDYITTTSRIFLESVTANNEDDPNSTNTCSVYRMEYDQPESLPVRFSTSQDILGYYNNRFNSTVLPSYYDINFSGLFDNLADRFVNFEYAKKGSLSKIYYPSGGHTAFEYEAPKVKTKRIYNNHLELYQNQTNRIPETKSSGAFSIGGPLVQIGVPAQPLDIEQTISVNISTEANGFLHFNDRIYLDLTNADTQEVTTQFLALGTSLNGNFNFDLESGYSYVLMARIETQSNTPFTTNISFQYLNNVESDAYGIRVKSINEYPNDTSVPLVKRYYYKRAEKALGFYEDEESAIITYNPKTIKRDLLGSCCNSESSDLSSFSYLTLLSNPFAYFSASADNQVSYKYVTVSLGGDLFEEGGVEKEFRIEKPDDPTLIHIPDLVTDRGQEYAGFYADNLFMGSFSDNNTMFNGAPVKQTHIKNETGILYKVKETQYIYDLQVVDQTEGIILTSNTRDCGLVFDLYMHSVSNYNNFSYNFNLISSETKDYVGDILPPVIPFEPSNGPGGPEPEPEYSFVSSEQRIEYHPTFTARPKLVETTNSDGSIKRVVSYYLTADDISNLAGLTPEELAAYNSLITQNRLASPIQVETYYKEDSELTTPIELTSRQRTLFGTFNGLTLPKKSMSAKLSNPLENNTVYSKYDSEGYPLEVSAEDDIKKSFIYGYKDKKVIAELVNQSYDAIPQATIDNLHALANAVIDESSQNALELALDQLRIDFREARVNTYVYNELGQLTSMKDNRGYRVSYIYDNCYRLRQVKDQDGNIIEEHNYNVLTNN